MVDYNLYSEALKGVQKLEKSAKKTGSNIVQVKKADYLKNYFEGTDTEEITLEEANNILENKISRTQVTSDGEPLTKQVSVKNRTYLLGTDGLGRDLFIRIVTRQNLPARGLFRRVHQLRGGCVLRGHRGLRGRPGGQHHDAYRGRSGLHPHDPVRDFDHGGGRAGYRLHHPLPWA